RLLNDTMYLLQYSLNPDNAIAIFISDQYEFYWNTSAPQLMERMFREYQKFWNESRTEKAQAQNLTPLEAITLASIVEEETNNAAEKPRIAGVYLNRLKKGMKLQADPTVKFALQQFELKRVTTRQTHLESPFNTYHAEGLPPGPICIPSRQSIEAVLNPESHGYLFFCAKGDGSGTHVFAETYKQHQANARRYRKILDFNNIF
ncbi:MAG TPA: endolytic transglycosylase MltG, partial [Chitinophagales bacterium]|nr:endolytic transglycosylase MltG [Chitinophagales bacterium]